MITSDSHLRRLHELFETARYAELARHMVDFEAEDPELEQAGARRVLYRWWFLREDYARLAAILAARGAGELDEDAGKISPGCTADDLLAAGRLRLELLRPAEAEGFYSAACAATEMPEEETPREDAIKLHARAIAGLGAVHARQLRFDDALTRYHEALDLEPRQPDLLLGLANALIRLGRTSEAIDAAETAVEVSPWHERANYLLGNGYARWTYRELEERRGVTFGAAEECVRRGGEAWLSGAFEDARAAFFEALELCPGHGRAHNGLARTLEVERRALAVHHQADAARFEATEMPKIPRLEEYVVNWADLAPRYRKRVALSVAPWQEYLPALLEAGASCYLKPIQERLCESPGQELLRDQRISYDARLWDDVRGCGGYSMVTGIEDVESTIWHGYDTVLHELTHQVHQLLPRSTARRAEALYRSAKARQASEEDIFLSRYAAENVWEYVAEGANALGSPRRDRWDRREIVRERLEPRDPELIAWIVALQEEPPTAELGTRAAAARGDDRLRHGDVAGALESFEKAVASTREEGALAMRIFALQAARRSDEALAAAEDAASELPESADLAVAVAESRWLAGHGLTAAIDALEAARPRVREDDLADLLVRLGSLRWTAGESESAARAYALVLEGEPDHPMALWGLASSLALASHRQESWARYEQAIRRRSGSIDLRVSFACDLLRADEYQRSREQIDAALLLDPDDPGAVALDARWTLGASGAATADGAAQRTAAVLEKAPWHDELRLAHALAQRAQGDTAAAEVALAPLLYRLDVGAPPELVYRPETGGWIWAHTLPSVLRRELSKLREIGG